MLHVLLSAGRGRPARTPFGFLVWALPVVVQRLSAVRAACRSSALASAGGSVERAISRSRRCFQRAASVSSWPPPPVGRGSWGLMPLAARHTAISPMRAVLGWLPGGAQAGWAVTLAGVVLDLVGEVGDQLGSLCQVVPQTGWAWSVAGMPGSQGSGPGSVGVSAGRRQSRTAAMSPAVLRSRPAGGCQQVAEWVLTGFGREGEQVGSQGRPGGFVGESGDVAGRLRSSSATVWGPTSCSAATWRPSV